MILVIVMTIRGSPNSLFGWDMTSQLKPYMVVIAIDMNRIGCVDKKFYGSHSFWRCHYFVSSVIFYLRFPAPNVVFSDYCSAPAVTQS